ncbi:hypothetical protein O6H91_14G002700 [Diphasiastrum complanatum]|uniref:Uncharacterized protein n=1 Tax=Diphasiastrum complanatum TaxID=34168 RepID=A0ACC2BKX0_DIPCM|nr:hypothetical protein O6H91_14G002700 [Diphasiastrum complanatum]
MKSITPLSFCKISKLVGSLLGHWQHSCRQREFCVHEVTMSRPFTLFLREYAKRQAITILWLTLILVTTLLLRRLAKLLRFWIKGNRLPGPPLKVPLGRFCAISKTGCPSDFSIYLAALHKQYGPIVRVWLGPTHLLVSVNDHEIIKNVMALSKDRVPATRTALELAFGKESIFISTYKKARKKRFSLHRVLNGNIVEKLHSISIQVCNQVDKWTTPGLSGMELDAQVLSQHMVFSVLGAILFGDSFLVWPSAEEFEKLLFMISEKVCYWARYPVTPFWTDGFKQYKEMCLRAQGLVEEILALSRYMKDKAGTCVTEHKINQYYEGISIFSTGTETKYAEEVWEDTVDSMAVGQDFEADAQDVHENLFGTMFHGCRTMAVIMGCVLTRLAQHPEIQDKVHAEIDLVCGGRSPPSTDDIKKMKYLVAILYESARLLPTRHLLQRCALDHDLKLSPSTIIPAGAVIALPVKVMNMDVQIWGHDVHEFNPDRFLQSFTASDGKPLTYKSKNPFCNAQSPDVPWGVEGKRASLDGKLSSKSLASNPSLLLFGGGSRSCIGRTFAMTEMTSLLASLFQRYKEDLSTHSTKKIIKTIAAIGGC